MTLLMIFQRFFTGFVLLHHTFQFSGAKLCFFVVIVIVPLLKFLEVRLLEFWFHDGSDFEEEIKLFDEVFSTLILGFIGVIDDDVVEPAISDIGEEMFYVKILDFEIEFATDGWGFDSFASFHLQFSFSIKLSLQGFILQHTFWFIFHSLLKYGVLLKSIIANMSLSARKFMSVSLQLSLQACNIVKQYSVDKNMKKYQKGHDDHVTEADYKIQSMLVKGFKMHFPGLRIIGQETQQFKGDIDFDYSKLKQDLLDSKIEIKDQQNITQCCLWIDPIDCTKGFIEGTLQDVTVLIGMSTNRKPSLGVIGIPFKKVNEGRIFAPEVLIGSVKDEKAYKYRNKQWVQIQKRDRKDSNLIITTSVSRSNPIQESYVKHFKTKNILAGGSGRKIALVIKGEADMMAYVGSATSKWDSCAGEAIIRAMGGNFTTPLGNEINYDPNDSLQNKEGIFCSFDKEIHSKSVDFIKSLKIDI